LEKFDVCIIGGGPAGYAAAMRAIDFGKKVILIEKGKVGGAGIYDGALTSKTTWELSHKVATINEMMEQNGRPRFEIPWEDVQQTVKEAIFDRKQQYSAHIKLLQEETSTVRFTYARGTGRLLSKNEVQIISEKVFPPTIVTSFSQETKTRFRQLTKKRNLPNLMTNN
jgi:dihydrolipoamide dehydrogenase